MKNILISDKPESVAKILNGEKTAKIMKNAPKCELPIEVYIYCTRSAPYLHPWNEPAAIEPGGPRGTNKVTWKKSWRLDKAKRYMSWNGKIVAKFTLKKIEEIEPFSFFKILAEGTTKKQKEIADKACSNWFEISGYANHKPICLWHIDDLEIFDEPKELSEFYSLRLDKDVTKLLDNSIQLSNGKWVKRLDKAPQSWCYVEEDE